MESRNSVKSSLTGFIGTLCRLLALATCMLGLAMPAAAAPLTIVVKGVKADGNTEPVANYRWTVEEDATKLSVPGHPANGGNYSLGFHTSYMPVVAAGRAGMVIQAHKACASATSDTPPAGCDPDVLRLYRQALPDLTTGKRYYVSVAAEGYQVGGAPVVFDSNSANATVYLNAYGKDGVPTARLSVFVFRDSSPINGAPDLPQEQQTPPTDKNRFPVETFTVKLLEAGGTYGASGGEVTQDAFGNPLGTTYSDANGTVNVRGTGILHPDANGELLIDNLFPAKYTILVVPPAGKGYVQTSTIEGTRGIDAWVKNNEPKLFYSFGGGGHHVFVGFTKAGNDPAGLGGLPAIGGKKVSGRITAAHDARPPLIEVVANSGAPVPECWVGLHNGATRDVLSVVKCDAKSEFKFEHVPAGNYELVVWDDPLDIVISSTTVTVGTADVALGDLPQLNWFTRYQGRIFQDIDGTGLPYFSEAYERPYVHVDPKTGVETVRQQPFAKGQLKPPLGAGIANNLRFRDGSIYQSVTTKDDGTFAFTEAFPFFNWLVAEVDYARFKATSATVVVDQGGEVDAASNLSKLWGQTPTTPYTGLFGNADPALKYNPWIRINPQQQADSECPPGRSPPCYFRTESVKGGPGAILLEPMQAQGNQTNHIEWGKVPYTIEENGGIAGIVYYAITRAEDDPRYAAAENWEPGIPRVQVNVFLDCDGDTHPDKPKNDGTGQCSELSSAGYKYDPPDVDNFPFCWRDPGSLGCPAGSTPIKGPEDVKRSRTGAATEFSYGDVFRWGAPKTDILTNPGPDDQTEIGLGRTDGWDDSIPTGCPDSRGKYVVPGTTDTIDCHDGFRNFNQVRPGVFDGGFAFGRVANQAELPTIIGDGKKGTYIVEAVAPPGYLHQGNGDKNVVFGDRLASRPAALPHECVGPELDVPEFLTLFDIGAADGANPNHGSPQYPNNKWRKCDMKAVPLLPGQNAAPNFFLFTEAPVASHGAGTLTDDINTEFNKASVNFGEKHAPPWIPISIRDWTGREIGRTYADQNGRYNFIAPSSFTINPPYPSGVMPNMLQACLNDPGPITTDPVTGVAYDQPQIDPFFHRGYTQLCNTLQFLPGKTTYLDTPMLPLSAFAAAETQPLDCECGDKTPEIFSASNATLANGPYVNSTNKTLKIVSSGWRPVVNPGYDVNAQPPSPDNLKTQKTVLRDFGFGSLKGTVQLNGVAVPDANVTWSADGGVITVTVPESYFSAAAGQYELTVTRGDNSKESVVGVTVHVNGPAPITVAAGGSIQAAIDAASAGDLITIAPGTYLEPLILDKRVRLQGWGAGSTQISTITAKANLPEAWRADIERRATLGTFSLLPGQTQGTAAGSTLTPALFGGEEAPGILVVGKSAANNELACADTAKPLRIDGLTITGANTGGGILASGYACGLQVSNNRVFGNYGTYGGGIRVGHVALVNGATFTDAVNRNVGIHHNWVAQNGGTEAGGSGGITLGTGADNYSVARNYVCGNFTLSDGGGIAHLGLSPGASIANNTIVFNETFNQANNPTGGGLFIAGLNPGGGLPTDGTGNVTVNANLFQGNHAGAGAGGGLSIARTLAADNVVLTNNMIVNNVAGYAGGGVVLDSVTNNVRLVNNTVAGNASTGTSRQSFGPAGPTAPSLKQVAGVALLSGDAPRLLNNILWGNRQYIHLISGGRSGLCDPGSTSIDGTTGVCNVIGASYNDLGAVSPTSGALVPRYSLFTAGAPYAGNSNQFADATAGAALFVKSNTFTDTLQSAATVDEGGNFVSVIYSPLTVWDIDATTGAVLATPYADYHLAAGATVAINAGRSKGTTNGDIEAGADYVPTRDFDDQTRVNPVDIGADEAPVPAPSMTVTPTALAFGNVSLNTNRVLTVTVSNAASATAALTLGAPTITAGPNTGGNTSQPPRYSQTTNCPASLAAGSSCVITVTFAPTQLLLQTQTATLNVNATNAPVQQVALTGTGVIPLYSITPATHDFGTLPVDAVSAPFGYTVTNTNQSPGNLVFTGASALVTGQFAAATGGTCTAATILTPGQSCTVNVTFNPSTSAGPKLGSVNAPVTVGALGLPGLATGSATAPNPGINCPGGIDLGSVTCLVPNAFAYSYSNVNGSVTKTFTVTNSIPLGGIAVAYRINGITVAKTNTGDGSYARATAPNTGTCVVGTTVLQPGQSCTIGVTFTSPSGNSTTTGSVSVSGTTNPAGTSAFTATRNLTGN